MAKLKDLKSEEFVIDFVEIFAEMDPTETNKYVPFFMKLSKNYIKDVRTDFINDTFKNVNELVNDFEDLVKRNQIENKDIYSYGSYEEIEKAVKEGKAKITESQVKKNETIILYEDDNYLLVRPKSIRSSKVYGATTKWCTASDRADYEQYFYNYTRNGILIYFINKKENPQENVYGKIAFHNDLSNGSTKITAWDVKDSQIQSNLFEVIGQHIPLKIYEIIHTTLYSGEVIETIK